MVKLSCSSHALQLRQSYIEISYFLDRLRGSHSHLQQSSSSSHQRCSHSTITSRWTTYQRPQARSQRPFELCRSQGSRRGNANYRKHLTHLPEPEIQRISKVLSQYAQRSNVLQHRYVVELTHLAYLPSQITQWNYLEKIVPPPRQEDGYIPPGEIVSLYGYITSRRTGGKGVTFATLIDPTLRRSVQLYNYVPPLNRPPIQTEESQNVADPYREDSDASQDTAVSVDAESETLVDAGPAETISESPLDDAEQAGTDAIASTNERDLQTKGQEKPDFPAAQLKLGKLLNSFAHHTPVMIRGKVRERQHRKSNNRTNVLVDRWVGATDHIANLEIDLFHIYPLNTFPDEAIVMSETSFGPDQRHLQFRTDRQLRDRIRLRSRLTALSRKSMFLQGFDEIDTPLLFKSTPEGAREFMVPTRQKGQAYALPQSPQQYKQLLMASGFPRYFQFARCFRDEDQRTDRQPEFTQVSPTELSFASQRCTNRTQLDLEMAFAGPQQVMQVIEKLLHESLMPVVVPFSRPTRTADQIITFNDGTPDVNDEPALHMRRRPSEIPRISYHAAMEHYGTDKPDRRLGSAIKRIDEIVPPNLKGMLTSLPDPIIEIVKISLRGSDPAQSRKFITSFLDSPTGEPYTKNPDGMPGITVYDPEKPLGGLASFGHDGAETIMQLMHPGIGDLLLVQSRPNKPFQGEGSTTLGRLRSEVAHAANKQTMLKRSLDGFAMMWVTHFPLFTPLKAEDDVGQGGSAGICSTHHPFTAPLAGEKLDLVNLVNDPLSLLGDSFDLVINGVEVGGGSRRIHDSKMQEFILKDVLKLSGDRVESFRHLLKALEMGCPPHAGFAMGFDRLLAVLSGVESVRDVIAFPKDGQGVDRLVKAPSAITEEMLKTYHLKVSDEVEAEGTAKVSKKA